MAVLNVTPDEFRRLQEAAFDAVDLNGRFIEAEFIRLASLAIAGMPKDGRYEVVVRHAVPSIPWFTRGVHRIGPDRDAWGGQDRRFK